MEDRRVNGLDLFSGLGGIALALHPYVRTVGYCEIEPYCQRVLTKRMEQGLLDVAPIHKDVTKLKRGDLSEPVDIICGGFPCQDISVAGLGKGLEGERSGLFFEIARLVSELRPAFVFLENVPAVTIRGGTAVVATLTSLGYQCRWGIISAQCIGAWHKRERWWLLAKRTMADTHSQRLEADKAITERLKEKLTLAGDGNSHVSDTSIERQPRREVPASTWNESTNLETRYQGWSQALEHLRLWPFEPSVGRVADGVPHRVERLKAIGNAVVPLQARIAFETLIGIKRLESR